MKYSLHLGIAMLLSHTVAYCSFAATLNVDTILGPDHPYPNQTITVIDGVDPPTQVDVLEGALVGGTPFGPTVPVGMELRGSSIVRSYGVIQGLEKALLLQDRSTFRMFDGNIFSGHIEARENSRVIIDGGIWRDARAFDSSTLRINGGSPGIFEAEAHDEPRLVVSGGEMRLTTYGSSTALVRGGGFNLATLGGGDVLITDGAFGEGVFVESGTVRIRGILGSSFGDGGLLSVGNGEAHIYGFGLRFEVDDEDGPIITGRLADGDLFAVPYAGSNIFLHEVPEPASWGMLAIGVAGITAAGWSRTRATKLRQ